MSCNLRGQQLGLDLASQSILLSLLLCPVIDHVTSFCLFSTLE